MQKKWFLIGTAAIGAVGLAYAVHQKNQQPFSFRGVARKMKNSGYATFKTPDKGVFLLVKDQKRSLLIYENQTFTNETLFNLLHKYENGCDADIFLLSESTNTLYGRTKPLFYRWHSNRSEHPTIRAVHFSTLSHFMQEEEPSWESFPLETR